MLVAGLPAEHSSAVPPCIPQPPGIRLFNAQLRVSQRHEAKQQHSALLDKLEKKRFKKDEVKASFVKECEERFRTTFRQQQLQLQSQLQVRMACQPTCLVLLQIRTQRVQSKPRHQLASFSHLQRGTLL